MTSNFANESYLFTQISTIAKTYTTNGARTVYIYIAFSAPFVRFCYCIDFKAAFFIILTFILT